MSSDSQEPNRPAQVFERGERPPGILSRHTQAKVLGGIAVLMVLAIAFSGTPPPKDVKKPETPAMPPPVGITEERIRDYRARIEEQTRKLASEQAQLAQTKEALGMSKETASGARPGYGASTAYMPPPSAYGEPERTWKAEEREKREYRSHFASNVALSYRSESKPESSGRPYSGFALPSSRREEEDPKQLPGVDNSRQAVASSEQKYPIMEGTFLETVLTNRLDGSFSGPVSCLVSAEVYSRDRRKVLIPKGSRVLGEAKHVDSFGQKRIAVVFHRLLIPHGASYDLKQYPGLNQIGETGLRDKVNNHYLQVFGVSVALGLLAGFSQSDTRSGFNASGEDAYRQGVADSLSQSSVRILDRYLNVLPTFTIREGHRVKVYLTGDLFLPAYSSVDEARPQ